MGTAQFTPAQAVDRPDLLAALDRATSEEALTLLVAQAGFGKSVLLSQWVDSRPDLAVAWVNLAEQDDDPAQFIRHLLDQLTLIDPGFEELAPLAALHDAGLGDPFRDELLRRLSTAGQLAVVLEDLHRLSNQQLIRDIALLAESAPANLHLVISCRADPPVSWNTLRLRGEVTEFREAQLALSAEEAQRLIEGVSRRPISMASAEALVDRTEGWAAAIQLAGISLRRRDDVDEFVAQFSGSDRLIAEYLSEEVLASQTPAHRRLLLRFSALDRMSTELIQAVVGDADAHRFFDDLERLSMFLIPLDDRREWYRFHHLFRDLLRHRLRADDSEAEQELLIRAAHWHLGRGETASAIDYLLRAHAWDDALTVILAHRGRAFEQRETGLMVAWLTQIPESAFADPVDIQMLIAILQGVQGENVDAEDVLNRIANAPASSPGQLLCAHAFLAELAQWRPRPAVSLGHAIRALDILAHDPDVEPPDLINLTDRPSLETMALVAGGRAHFLLGDVEESRRWLQRALDSEGASYSVWQISALGSLALLEAWFGDAERADELADEAIRIAVDASAVAHSSTADAYFARALVARDRNRPDRAASALRDGHARAAANGRTQLLWISYLIRTSLMTDGGADLLTPAGPPPPIVRDGLVAQRVARLGSGALYEPLTEREKEFLAYLPTLYTHSEIAERCFVSVNTVKTHISHIYRKLDVSTRKEAIVRAQQIGLLEQRSSTLQVVHTP